MLGHLRRLHAGRPARRAALGFWPALRARGAGGRRARRADRDAAAAPHLPRARAVPAARDLRAGAGDQGRGALRSGARKTCSARARRASRGAVEILGRAVPDLRPVPDRRRAGGARPAVAAADAHALGHAGARRHAGPRDGRRARRQPGLALHRGVRARRAARRPRRRAAAAARAGQPRPRPQHHRRRLRRRRGRRHGLDPRRLRRGAADRRDQGDLHRLGAVEVFGVAVLVLQAHAGRRVPGHGGRAGRAALGPVRPAAGAEPRAGRARGAAAARRTAR